MQTLGKNNRGKVILAGAGPGDPELITLKALKYLQQADVILTDRLVAPELIADFAKPNANVVYVGKQCSKGIHTPQKTINELMVSYALAGNLVLRLKGGDANIFSNILDELQVLVQYNINYEIIPGISAALGASAYTGIPLTARGHGQAVRFVTLCKSEKINDAQWKEWVSTEDTLVFYMSGQKLKSLAHHFIQHGVNTEKGIAVIQQATTPEQQTSVYSFADMNPDELPDFEFVPTLIIVGKVVNLHSSFAWYAEKENTISYFDNHTPVLSHAI